MLIKTKQKKMTHCYSLDMLESHEKGYFSSVTKRLFLRVIQAY